MAFVDNVVIHDKRYGFCPLICGFQVFEQADEQYCNFTVAANVADFSRATV